MGTSERKARYHFLILLGALVMGALLVVVVLMGPMSAAQANQRGADAKKEDQKNKTVQVTAAGENNYRAKADWNPIIYKSVDSRPDFNGGFYSHVLRCPDGYGAIGGGFDLNTPSKGNNVGVYWQILASHPSVYNRQIGDAWTVVAYGHTRFFSKNLPKFSAFAACAPHKLIRGVSYVNEDTALSKKEHKTIWSTCGRDERVIGGGFDFHYNRDLQLVRTERSREDERSWGTGAFLSDGSSANMRDWAVCVPSDRLEATAYKEDANHVPLAGRAVATTPGCPDETYLLSGGAGMNNNAYDSPSEPLWSNSSPPHIGEQDPDKWKASAVQNERGAFTVHAFALCGKFRR